MGRVGLAFRCFFRVLGGKPVPSEVEREESDEPLALPPGPPEVSDEEKIGRSVQLIGLLQNEGRLLDFIQENIDDYDDGQVGAAVRALRRACNDEVRSLPRRSLLLT